MVTLHESLILRLIEDVPDARRRFFMRNVNLVLSPPINPVEIEEANLTPEEIEEMRAECRHPARIFPDAYVFDEPVKLVTVFEVEVTHQLPREKLEIYVDLWWALDNVDWELGLITIDRFGVRRAVDLYDLSLAMRKETAEPIQPSPTTQEIELTHILHNSQLKRPKPWLAYVK